jgi:hypothetical protein
MHPSLKPKKQWLKERKISGLMRQEKKGWEKALKAKKAKESAMRDTSGSIVVFPSYRRGW